MYFVSDCGISSTIRGSGNIRCVSGDYLDKKYNFLDNGNGTLIDISTGIIWQKCALGASGSDCQNGTPSELTWNDALVACKSLSLNGRQWKLPNINETMSFHSRFTDFTADLSSFPMDSSYSEGSWASTTSNQDKSKAYYNKDFRANRIEKLKTATNRVRCISVAQ